MQQYGIISYEFLATLAHEQPIQNAKNICAFASDTQ